MLWIVVTELWQTLPGALRRAGPLDRVELKVGVADGQDEAMLRGLGVDPRDAEVRSVYFLDTPDLALTRSDLVLRVRRSTSGRAESVVKLRRSTRGSRWVRRLRSPNLVRELDVQPCSAVLSAEVRQKLRPRAVAAAIAGRRPLRGLISAEQRDILRGRAGRGLDLGELIVLGPVRVLRSACGRAGLGGLTAAELWCYPDGSRMLELSVKCRPARAVEVAHLASEALAQRGIVVCGGSESKSARSVEFFAGRPIADRPAR